MDTLTVKELINKLKEYPDDIEVLVCVGKPYEVTYCDIQEIYIDKDVSDPGYPYLILQGYDE